MRKALQRSSCNVLGTQSATLSLTLPFQNVKEILHEEAAATEAWLEGLSRRYGRGAQPVLAHKQSLGGYLHLPWSLKKSTPGDAAFEAPQQSEQDKCFHHDTVMVSRN